MAFVADVAHLIKSIRNALFTNEVMYVSDEFVEMFDLDTNEVRLSVLEDVIEFKEKRELKIAPRVSKKKCLELGTYGKMDVGPAVALLSQDMASAIEHLVLYYDRPRSWLTTSQFCSIVGRWFDICSSRQRGISFDKKSPTRAKSLSDHLELFMEYFGTMAIKENQKTLYVVQKGVIASTKSILWLKDKLLAQDDVQFYLPGRVLGDSVENYHSLMRQMGPGAATLEYKRFAKSLGVCHCLKKKKVKGSSYDLDVTDEWLADLESLKKMQRESNSDELKDIEHFKSIDFNPMDFSEMAALANLAGYILYHTILTTSKCKTCMKSFVEGEDDEPQGVNGLIDSRDLSDYGTGLTRPNTLANKMFLTAEETFRLHRNDLKGQVKLTDKFKFLILRSLRQKYEFPECHIKIIIGRFVRCREYFWGNHRTEIVQDVNKAVIASEANASWTTAAMNKIV